MSVYFTAVFKGSPEGLEAKSLSQGENKCVGIAGGNAHAERCRLREVLLPFAVVAKYVNKHNPDAPDNDEIGGITIGDCRRALAALKPE